jgi:predicted metal-dependent phosphoesterase TrpH
MTAGIKIDLHIHTSTGSDGAMTLEEVFSEAKQIGIGLISITDHGAIHHLGKAVELATESNIRYLTGVELNVSFPYGGKDRSLDFLGYGFNFKNPELNAKLETMQEYDTRRGFKILENLNQRFAEEYLPPFTEEDLNRMMEGIDGILSRPHIANYLVKKHIVADQQEAFDRYLVACNVPRYPLRLEEASPLIHNAGGKLALAHPNDGNGTSLAPITKDLDEQTNLIRKEMMDYIDGIECWHSRSDTATSLHYVEFCRKNNLMMTGGSDCHQKPTLLGTVDVPKFVEKQFQLVPGYYLP